MPSHQYKVTTVAEEYQKNPELKKEDIRNLQEWVAKESHLPDIPEDQLILFLHSCYYSMEKAKKTIEASYTIRTHAPELFADRDPRRPELQAVWDIFEQQTKFIQERIASAEKHLAELCTAFSAYMNKSAGVRDRTDDIVQTVQSYTEAESVNKSLKNGLLQFSSTMATIGDYRDAQVQRLERKVVDELSLYEGICKHAKEELKNMFAVRDRELTRRRQLDRVRERNPQNRQQINIAESELIKATTDLQRTIKLLEEQIDIFEKKKLNDIKSILLNYITIELSFHTKAIELFTKAYQEINDIDIDEDLEDFQQLRGSLDAEFRNALQVPESVQRLETVKRASFMNSTFSLSNLFATPPAFQRNSQTTNRASAGSSKENVQRSTESVMVEDFASADSSSATSEEDSQRYALNYKK